ITSGTQQSLFLITQGLLKPGDCIAIESPSYFYALELFQASGVKICAVKTDSAGLCLDDFAKLVSKRRIKCLFLNPIFQNPTGIVLSVERRMALIEFCQQHNIVIIEDDACSILKFEQQVDITPLKKFARPQQVIYLGTLSKLIGRNIRVGWLIAPPSI